MIAQKEKVVNSCSMTIKMVKLLIIVNKSIIKNRFGAVCILK